MEFLWLLVLVPIIGGLIWLLKAKICRWWDCGAIKRAWRKCEPDSHDYDLEPNENKYREYDRYFTDVNDWRLEGEQNDRDSPEDC